MVRSTSKRIEDRQLQGKGAPSHLRHAKVARTLRDRIASNEPVRMKRPSDGYRQISLTGATLTPDRTALRPIEDVDDEIRREMIGKWHLRGYTKFEIYQRLPNIARHVIDDDLNLLKERWSATIVDTDVAIREELERLRQLEAELWQAWEASKAWVDLPDYIREAVQGELGLRIPLGGDPAYTAQILQCMDRRIKLLGLDAPLKIDISAKVKAMAEAAGFDGDEAIEVAYQVIKENKFLGPASH